MIKGRLLAKGRVLRSHPRKKGKRFLHTHVFTRRRVENVFNYLSYASSLSIAGTYIRCENLLVSFFDHFQQTTKMKNVEQYRRYIIYIII